MRQRVSVRSNHWTLDEGQSTILSGDRTGKPARYHYWWCACFFILFFINISSCGRKRGDLLNGNIDTLMFTTMTENVHTLISDSGITKYKLQTKVWYTFDNPESKWYFPEGIYIEQFDTLFNIEASVQADTAYYYQDKSLWELKGNVRVLNREGQRFFAKTIYWNEQEGEVYSHDPVRIERSEGELLMSQYGFKSNQDMTKYELYSSSGHLDVEDQPMTQSDTLQVQTPIAENTVRQNESVLSPTDTTVMNRVPALPKRDEKV